MWYRDRFDQPCDICLTYGGWYVCGNSENWCKENPLKGRETIERGQLEWFTFDAARSDNEQRHR